MFRKASKYQGKKTRRALRIFVLALSSLWLYGSTLSNAETQSFDRLAARAQGAMEANQIPKAILLYRRATALRPTWSEGWWYLGTMLFDSNQLTDARDAFLQFVAVEHEQPGPGFGMLGLTEFKLKDYRSALAALERGRALGLGTNTAFAQRALYEDGILQNLFGQPEIALVRLTLIANQIAAAHPNMPEDAVLSDTDLLNAFGLAALRIPKLPSEIPSSQADLIQQAGHAQALVAMQDRTAAGQEMKQLVSKYPSQPNIHYMYGVYLLKEDPPSATRQFREELAVSPKSAAARIQLAFEFLRVGKYQEGLIYAREAVALVPGNFAAHVACGELWLGVGKTTSAINELEIAVKESPGSPDAHFALSRALMAAGRRRDAVKQRGEFERLKALSTEENRQ